MFAFIPRRATGRFTRHLILLLFAFLVGWSATPSQAQISPDAYREQVNANTVTIMGGSLTGTYIRLADDIARSVGNGNDLRILPIKGGVVGNVRDILYLRGIDMAIVRADVLETFRNKPLYQNLESRLNYITTLHLEEFHLMASDPNIRSIDDLEGKVVAFHNEAHVSGALLLNRLGIKVKKAIKTTIFAGAAKTKTGEYDAIIRITGKSFRGVGRLMKLNPKLRLLPIKYRDSLVNSLYLPTEITHEDYPELLPEGGKVETVAVKAVLGVYNWKPGTDRYRRLTKFVNAFFSNYDRILRRPGRHKKWDTINLAASIPGWKRFPPAAEWIEKWKVRQQSATAEQSKQLVAKFRAFVQSKPELVRRELDEARTQRLFVEFMQWINARNAKLPKQTER
jgi:uncharacterized protein